MMVEGARLRSGGPQVLYTYTLLNVVVLVRRLDTLSHRSIYDAGKNAARLLADPYPEIVLHSQDTPLAASWLANPLRSGIA